MGFYSSPHVLQQFATLNLYSMKIKEQTRKLAAGYPKQCFEVVDETDEVSHIYNSRRRWRALKSIKWFVLERLELKDDV